MGRGEGCSERGASLQAGTGWEAAGRRRPLQQQCAHGRDHEAHLGARGAAREEASHVVNERYELQQQRAGTGERRVRARRAAPARAGAHGTPVLAPPAPGRQPTPHSPPTCATQKSREKMYECVTKET